MEGSKNSDSRGALIDLEGLDRCGNTSRCSRLLSFLEKSGHKVESWRFPDRNTGVGQMISSYLTNNSQLDYQSIMLSINSSVQIVGRRAAKGIGVEWCKAPEVGLLAPDLVLYLDISPEQAAERGGYGGERYEKLEFQKTVAQSCKTLNDSTWKEKSMKFVKNGLNLLMISPVDDDDGG